MHSTHIQKKILFAEPGILNACHYGKNSVKDASFTNRPTIFDMGDTHSERNS